MLVDAHAFKPEFFCIFDLVQVLVVERLAFFRVIILIGKGYPGRRVFCFVVKVLG